jgi:peptidoglycan/xylan/chitin deacetylase (PgdA/CDA1 family)
VGTVGLVAQAAPACAVLPTFVDRPPRRLGRWCRWRWDDDRPLVALTFDDGPAPGDTEQTLDLLDLWGMRATFFCLGSQLARHPALAAEIVRRGHEVASHGHAHRHHLLRAPTFPARDLDRALGCHRDIFGVTPRWYRPPYGQCTAATLLAARRRGLETVLWSRWGREFAESHGAPVRRRLEPGLVPGGVLLLHDNDVSCRPGTAALTRATLPWLARALADRGLRAVSLAEVAGPAGMSGARA